MTDEDQWYDWDKLQVFISKTGVSVDMSEEQRWSNFNDQCEDKTLKMDESNLKNLGFERVHSNFQYFDDGTFNNLAPFTDISDLMGEVSGYIN